MLDKQKYAFSANRNIHDVKNCFQKTIAYRVTKRNRLLSPDTYYVLKISTIIFPSIKWNKRSLVIVVHICLLGWKNQHWITLK